ncbi:hypothetical protein [Scytonema sp. NUACC26]|uniref:hypothetical protein n=1 Tax=Scytonema sp. NUACC26 TaxID=3140176 RepID=UPI0034DCBC7C
MEFFEIKYNDGSVVKVKRVKRAELKDLITLQQDLIAAFVRNYAGIGSVISDDTVWSTIEKLTTMLPVVGGGLVELSKFEDDLNQLAKIFFTQSTDDNGIPLNMIAVHEGSEWYKPSLISELHQLDHITTSQEGIKKARPETVE